jgi:hypothetical protein
VGKPDSPGENGESPLQALKALALIANDPAEMWISLEGLGQRSRDARDIGLVHQADIPAVRVGTVYRGRR